MPLATDAMKEAAPPLHPMRNAVRFPLRLRAHVETVEGPGRRHGRKIFLRQACCSSCRLLRASAPSLRWTMQIPGADLGSRDDVTLQCVGRVMWHGPGKRGAAGGSSD